MMHMVALLNFHLPDGGTDWYKQRPKMLMRAFGASALHLAIGLLLVRCT